MFGKVRAYCAREETCARLTIVLLSLIVLDYVGITIFGRSLPATAVNVPWILQLHPERILAMAAAALGGFRLADHFQRGVSPIRPLLWILFASLIHLGSIGIQLGWFSSVQM